MEEVLKYLAVFFTSMVKFIAGPLLGVGTGLNYVETALFTFLGMMASVLLFSTLLGSRFRSWIARYVYKNRKLFSNKSRRIVKIWRAYGLHGVAFLTPVLFSPIIGTLIASSFGETKRRIFVFMFFSALFWSVVLSIAIFIIKDGAHFADIN